MIRPWDFFQKKKLGFFSKKLSKTANLCKNVAFLNNFENFHTGFETFFKGNETFFKNQSMFLRLFSKKLRLFSKIRPLRKILEKGLGKAHTVMLISSQGFLEGILSTDDQTLRLFSKKKFKIFFKKIIKNG